MRISFISFLALALLACSEFFSEDVSDSLITINSPADSLFTQSEEITFWWDEDRKVENYRFQLVSPSFDNPEFIFDTLMSVNELRLELTHAVYTWRLRAENVDSESAWKEQFMVVDTVPPTTPSLTSPTQNDTISLQTETLSFSWQSVDVPVDGFVLAVVDSLLIFRGDRLLFSTLATPPLELEKADSILGLRVGLSQLEWEIVSIDQAGNRAISSKSSFTLLQN